MAVVRHEGPLCFIFLLQSNPFFLHSCEVHISIQKPLPGQWVVWLHHLTSGHKLCYSTASDRIHSSQSNKYWLWDASPLGQKHSSISVVYMEIVGQTFGLCLIPFLTKQNWISLSEWLPPICGTVKGLLLIRTHLKEAVPGKPLINRYISSMFSTEERAPHSYEDCKSTECTRMDWGRKVQYNRKNQQVRQFQERSIQSRNRQ